MSTAILQKRKARINLNGKQRLPGVHFDPDDLYSPVAENDTLRTVLASAAANDLNIEHWDIESAFLHGTLPDGIDIYMLQPPRANGSMTHPDCVVKIGGNYYGARQGPKIFSDDLSKHLVLTGYHRSAADCCTFIIKSRDGKHSLILVVTVDDFMDRCRQLLAGKYTLKNLGPARHVLGCKIDRDRIARTLTISQPSYIRAILSEYNITPRKAASTPMIDTIDLTKA
jgi:hypothetical protein